MTLPHKRLHSIAKLSASFRKRIDPPTLEDGRLPPGAVSRAAAGPTPQLSGRLPTQQRVRKIATTYTYRVTWSEEDNEHVGLCAEFPSLSWLDATSEGALRGIMKLVRRTVAEMSDKKEAIPEPIATHEYSGEFKVRIPPQLHRRLAMEAAEGHVSLNRWVSMKLADG